MSEPATLPHYLLRNETAMPHRVAFRERRRGIWQELSWRDYAEMVRRIGGWLAARGFGPGARLGVSGENRPPLYAAMLAAQALGGAAVPLHPDAEPGRMVHILRDCRASIVVTEETEAAEALRAAGDRLPDLAQVASLQDPDWMAAAFPAGSIDAAIAAQDVALLLYPWRPDTLPRPAVLSHAALLAAAGTIAETVGVRPADRALAYLPLASFEDAVYSQALALRTGFSCNCPEGPDTVPRDLRELGPTILVAPPRLFELLAARLDAAAATAGPLKRRLYTAFTRLAETAAERRAQGRPLSFGAAAANLAGELMIHAPVRDRLGLGRARWVQVCEQPLAAAQVLRFRAFGVPLHSLDDGARAVAVAEAAARV